MNRKAFLKMTCLACAGTAVMPSLMQGCRSVKVSASRIVGSDLMISADEFLKDPNVPGSYRKYVVIHNEQLKFPVCIYRFDDDTYSAIWMQCSHQGTELQVFGDKLQCPAHGSEFNNYGEVENPPAFKSLRTFKVTREKNTIYISLKSVS